jgi:hypothetical protein
MKPMHKTSIATAIVTMLLAACGGGSDGAAQSAQPTQTTQSTQTASDTVASTPAQPITTACVDLTTNQVPPGRLGITPWGLSAGKAVLEFDVPNSQRPKIRICLGAAATPIQDPNLFNLGATYEVTVTPVAAGATGSLADLPNVSLRISYDTTTVPAGTDVSSLESRIAGYTDISGALAPTQNWGKEYQNPQLAAQTASGLIDVMTVAAGRYVVAMSR